jgi:heptosyltransferase-1
VKKILLIKTSSLGDVVHNFPAVSDIGRRFPGAVIDWVVEEAYAPLVRMHPAVHRAVPVAVRRWRRKLLEAATWRELADWRRLIAGERYDAVIDSQGLLKSAVLAASATGRKHGLDAASARERVAARFYDSVHHVPRHLHAVTRNRLLAAEALGYRYGELSYGFPPRAERDAGGSQVIFLHSTSRHDKHWLEQSWVELGQEMEKRGMQIVLPWGNDAERQRSERIRSKLTAAVVPPAMSLQQLAETFGQASAVVGLDTGLVHLAAALGCRVVAIHCSTSPELTGVFGAMRATNVGRAGQAPTVPQVIDAIDAVAPA